MLNYGLFTMPLPLSMRNLSASLLILALAGCAATEPAAPATGQASQPAPAPSTEPEAEIEYGSFTEEQLYQAIISEIGAQRGQLEDAGQNYFELAMSTRDLNIIRRAVQFASANGDTNALLQLGLLWSEVDTSDSRPHLMLAYEFLEGGDFDQAVSHMARVLDLGGEFDFTALAARTGQLDPAQRTRLINTIRELRDEFTSQRSLQLTLVQLLAQNQQYSESLAELDDLQNTYGNEAILVRLRAQIEQSNGQSEQALRTLRQGVRDYPDDKVLRQSYARLLIQGEDFSAARAQFQALVDMDATDWETWYSMALLDLEMQRYDSAADILKRLVGVNQRADEAQYYLGYIYEQTDDLAQAVEHYREVRIGTNNYLAAQQQATRLSIELGELEDAHSWLVNQSRGQPRLEVLFTTVESGALIAAGHTDRAREVLNRALNKYPNETDLLFARVLLNDAVGDQQGSEQDLRQIIAMQPDDSRALNHLGYMLADQTQRYDEALELLERAIAIEPDDPAIIDSLGWVQYKLGMLDEALENLRRAYADFPDHEVASHLGEVLWQLGRHDEARDIWQEGLENRPDSDLIREAMDRLIP